MAPPLFLRCTSTTWGDGLSCTDASDSGVLAVLVESSEEGFALGTGREFGVARACGSVVDARGDSVDA